MSVITTNKATGEVIELDTSSPEAIVQAWQVAQHYEKVSKDLKNQLKLLIPKLVGERTTSDEYNGYMFRISNVQRMNYDKAVLRQQLDEDVFDLLLEPKKTLVDKYIKENLEQLGEASTIIRNAMVPDGRGYQVIKLEKLNREEPK